ncbi:MAG: hypothetical protein A3K19_26080 [Lentisphaerae bacterium RIFOXYB12_FULL_65_16]|nr:MAG: hypothetical protein A3K18_08685 [Lentisphaerae bacterium RIFOXYA12_64_32]OGV87737.1 MAG: hypothetical protein A3K19_26080 [Lentisphaerae bacterium RIFOXYB12_FULL_65_16]
MDNFETLKHRLRDCAPLHIACAGLGASETDLEKCLRKEPADLVFVDIQHTPASDAEIVTFCQRAHALGVPALLRLLHPRLACLAGRYADFGALGVIVPMVETVDVVDAAIEGFYYPPVGKRSWGPCHAIGFTSKSDRRAYADRWNRTGILAVQFESIDAVTNARALAKPGVDLVLFGINDLSFSLEAHPESPLRTPQDCWRHVEDQLRGTGVRVASGPMPFGHFEK